ncbi:peptide chain release factor class I/class II domain containing protein [Rhodotorula toruloides]|uniref:Prokaryotic-type class I peptide chain release factors domain-containing protein n=1 Tax=Rhodotorula toruloides TaxID=5286 RepID=A0A0K3CBC7_RHOTO|nr:peptide chain release factor class I/class II domain containing protein [Rhodotorula toruloides]PRQ76012.1 hypothetical protein AAT19DRAFT_13034 [Rhodotorula toruloides]
MLVGTVSSWSRGVRLPSLARLASTVARPPSLAALNTQDDMKLARAWISAFEKLSAEDWPKNLTDVSFTRSSGPGGQHVNRTFSKAVVRLPLPSPTLLPPYVVAHLRRSPHYSNSPPSLLVSSSSHRTQQTNLADCLSKLKAAILDAARRDLVGETSEVQKEKVKELVVREKLRTAKAKKMRKETKSGRGKVRGWE